MVRTQYAKTVNKVAGNGTGVLHANTDFNIKRETPEFVKNSGMHTHKESRHSLNSVTPTERVTYGYETNSMHTKSHRQTSYPNQPSSSQTPPSGDDPMVSVYFGHGVFVITSGGVKYLQNSWHTTTTDGRYSKTVAGRSRLQL